jgi:hypothetical protein
MQNKGKQKAGEVSAEDAAARLTVKRAAADLSVLEIRQDEAA